MERVRRRQRQRRPRLHFTDGQREVFEALRHLQRAQIALDDQEARLVLAARREGLSNEQVAIALDVSASTIKHRYGAAHLGAQNGVRASVNVN